MSSPKRALLLLNLGTPDAPTPKAVRRFLKDFLSDPRVIEIPRLLWFFILRLLVLPFRPKPVAKLYESIWLTDSPQRLYGEQLAEKLTAQLDIPVVSSMCYGNPALHERLDSLKQQGVEELLIVPLFPQYSGSTTAAGVDALAAWLARQREIPGLTLVKDYWQEAAWQQAVAESISRYREQQGSAPKLLFSFHGIPQSYEDKGDHYPQRCRATAAAIAARLGLADDAWTLAFQSRFGKAAWVKPYTDEVVAELAQAGVEHLQVVCPGFAMDCLETLEEIAERNNGYFVAAGGKRLDYIPALNATEGQQRWLLATANRWLERH